MSLVASIANYERMAAASEDDWLVIIADWEDEADNKINIQDFILDGEPYIPIFSSVDSFRQQAAGSDFLEKGVMIRKVLLSEILPRDEVLILDPGSANPVRLTAKDI